MLENQEVRVTTNDVSCTASTAPSAGAVRAAQAIIDQTCQQVGLSGFLKNPATLREMAGLIDQQTGAPEMLTLLTELRNDIAKLGWGQRYPGRNHALMDRVDAAITKATGAA